MDGLLLSGVYDSREKSLPPASSSNSILLRRFRIPATIARREIANHRAAVLVRIGIQRFSDFCRAYNASPMSRIGAPVAPPPGLSDRGGPARACPTARIRAPPPVGPPETGRPASRAAPAGLTAHPAPARSRRADATRAPRASRGPRRTTAAPSAHQIGRAHV